MSIYNRVLSEGKIVATVLDKIAQATHENDHNFARQIGAIYLKDKKLAKAYKNLNDLHMYFGGLTDGVSSVRSELDKRLFAIAKKKLSKEEYENFYQSY